MTERDPHTRSDRARSRSRSRGGRFIRTQSLESLGAVRVCSCGRIIVPETGGGPFPEKTWPGACLDCGKDVSR